MFKVWKSASILVVVALVLSLGLVMAPLAGTAEARTLLVPDPYRTIQSAINDASAGDTILVGPGEYDENLEIYGGLDRLTIKSTSGAQVTTIIGTGLIAPGVAADGGGPVVAIYDVNGVTFDGFSVVNGGGFSWYGIPLPGCGIFISNASNCLIADNIIRDNEAGIFVLGGTFYPPPVAGMEEGVGQDGGIELVSDGNTIRDNEVYYNGGGDGVGGVGADGMMGTGYGIVLINCNETTVKSNEVYNNQYGGVFVMGGNIWMGDGDTMGGGTVGQPPPTLMGVARDNQIIYNEIYNEELPRGVAQPMFPPSGVMLWNTLRTTVSGNEIYNHVFGVFILGMTGETDGLICQGEAKGNVVSNNEIHDNEAVGVAIFGPGGGPFLGDLFGEAVGLPIDGDIYASDNDVTDNTIADNGEGVGVIGANNTRILGNDILNNTGGDTGIAISYDPYNTTEVHFNNIVGNSYSGEVTQGMSAKFSSYGVYNDGSNMLDATFNWWGDASGPYDPESVKGTTDGETEVCPCTDDPANESNEDGQGDAVSYNVDYCPWLLEWFNPATSAPATTGEGDVGYNTSDWDSAIIQHLEAKDPSEIDCLPEAGMYFPYGIFSFTVLLINPGDTVTVTITLPGNMPRGTKYWKCQNGEWVDATSLLGDDDGDNILTLTLTDGELGDTDGVANGRIDDPGGPAIPIPPTTKREAPEPTSFLASYLRITPPQVTPNQAVEVSVNVANTGGESGSRAVALYINGKAEQSQTVTVAPGSSQNVVFTVTKATPGTYNVRVEGQNGQFVVRSTSIFGGGGLGTGGIIAIVVVLIALIVGLIFVMRGAPGKA